MSYTFTIDHEPSTINSLKSQHAETDPATGGSPSVPAIVEMILKNWQQLDRLLRNEAMQREMIPRLMAIAVAGFAVFGIFLTAFINALNVRDGFWLIHLPKSHWGDFSAANLTLGYTLGLIAANGICLPSFYFYGLLAGIRITMLEVAAHALKGMAVGAVTLVGVLPVYVAVALTALVLPADHYRDGWYVVCGLVLPFLAGLVGAKNLYEGFVGLADTIRCADPDGRTCLLRRLIFAWCGCTTLVTPLVIYSLWDYLGGITG